MPSANPTLERPARAVLAAAEVPASRAPGRRFQRPPIRVVLAADDPYIRSSLQRLLYAADDGSFEVVAEASTNASARRFAHAHKPCVLVLALNMQHRSSLGAIPLIRRESPQAHIIVLANQDESGDICRALRAGATGYVLQDHAAEALAYAIRCAAAGHGYLTAAPGARAAGGTCSSHPAGHAHDSPAAAPRERVHGGRRIWRRS